MQQRARRTRERICVAAAQAFENSQIGVFLDYASDRGRALIDRELYLRPNPNWHRQ